MNIDQLPFEILVDIFSYVKRYENVLLVNKLFYTAACEAHDPNIYLTIDNNFFDGQWMSNISFIIRSTRRISRLNIYTLGRTETEQRAVISIIARFSFSIKYLKFAMLDFVNMSEILEILSLTPNVEQVICENLRLHSENQLSVNKTSTNGDLNLRMLKKLRCKSCFNKLSIVFNRLPVKVVQELDLHDFDFSAVTTLLKRQTSIKKLKLTACNYNYVNSDIFTNLTLEALELWHRPSDNCDLATLLSNQTELRSLKLRLVEADKNLIDFVTNQFPELESVSLAGPFSMPNNVSVAQVIQLKKVKNLSLLFKFTDEVGLIESLSDSVNPRITALTIGYGIYEFDLIQALAKTVPNLKILNLECPVYSMEADGFMRNFNFLEVLEIWRIVVVAVYDTEELTDGDYFNPKLKELVINGEFMDANRFLNKLIESYPNLKRLELKWKSITAWQLIKIVAGFTKLETLKLDGVIGLPFTIYFLNYLKNHKNLKLIALNGINIVE